MGPGVDPFDEVDVAPDASSPRLGGGLAPDACPRGGVFETDALFPADAALLPELLFLAEDALLGDALSEDGAFIADPPVFTGTARLVDA